VESLQSYIDMFVLHSFKIYMIFYIFGS